MRMPSSLWSLVFLFGMAHHANAQEAQLMPVPLRAIYPGEILESSNFTMKLFNVTPALRASYVFEQNQYERKEAVRTLAVGKPFLLQSIRTAEDVKKGQPTKAIYSSNTVEIQGTLVPLTGGSVGEVIEARNPASGGVVKAIVADGGTLLVIAK